MAQAALTAPPSSRGLRRAAWIACAVTTLLALGDLVLALFEPAEVVALGRRPVDAVVVVVEAVVVAVFGLLGAVVASRQPRNPVGWLLGLIGMSVGALAVTQALSWRLLATGDADDWSTVFAAWMHNWLWIPMIFPALTFLPLLFPTGRPPSPRWRWLLWSGLSASVLMFASVSASPGQFLEHPLIRNPTGVDGQVDQIVGGIAFALLVVTALGCIASLVVRFRRARGIERQQIRWAAVGGAILGVAFAIGSLIGFENDEGIASFGLLLLGLLAVAATIAVAMLRYRLYDIDVVINRALVYGALTAMLAGTYLGSILLLQLVLSGVTADNGLAIAASTLAVAALFQPLRTRIQAGVDRRFFRRKYDAARTLEGFAQHLRDEVDLDTLAAELRAVVGETMQPAHVSLWLRQR